MAVKRQVRLECSVCGSINYLTFRNPKSEPEKLQLKKYCKKCRKVTAHKETKSK